jgi:hypothetical protein
MAWDKFRMAQKFLQRANAIHPEDAEGEAAQTEALAIQDVYYDCYMSSFSREDLLKRLADIVAGKFEMPEETDVDESIYKDTYIREALRITGTIEKEES